MRSVTRATILTFGMFLCFQSGPVLAQKQKPKLRHGPERAARAAWTNEINYNVVRRQMEALNGAMAVYQTIYFQHSQIMPAPEFNLRLQFWTALTFGTPIERQAMLPFALNRVGAFENLLLRLQLTPTIQRFILGPNLRDRAMVAYHLTFCIFAADDPRFLGGRLDVLRWPYYGYSLKNVPASGLAAFNDPLAAQQIQQLQGIALQQQQLMAQMGAMKQLVTLFATKGEKELRLLLTDARPEVRWLSIQAIGGQGLPLEDELIASLLDPIPTVAQAARAALVHLSKGQDFGPPPDAWPAVKEQSVQRWKDWLKNRDAAKQRKP